MHYSFAGKQAALLTHILVSHFRATIQWVTVTASAQCAPQGLQSHLWGGLERNIDIIVRRSTRFTFHCKHGADYDKAAVGGS